MPFTKLHFEDIVGKGENAGGHHFLLKKGKHTVLVTIKLLSANAFNLDEAKICRLLKS